jgi:transposase
MRDELRWAHAARTRGLDAEGDDCLLHARAGALVIEVGGHSRWVSELLEGLGHRVTIANARRVKLISASDNKTDEHDAELLARLGRADARLLAPMVHRSSELQADLAIAKARDTLVATRTKLVNHVRGTVKSFGERLPKCSSVSFVRHTRALVPAALETALAPVYETIAKLDEQIRAQDKMIAQTAERHPDVAVLEQVDGVGVLTALVYVLTLEDKGRFAEGRMAGAYLGCGHANRNPATTTRSFGSRRRAIRSCVCWCSARTTSSDHSEKTATCVAGASSSPSEVARTQRNARRWPWRASWPYCCTGCGSRARCTSLSATNRDVSRTRHRKRRRGQQQWPSLQIHRRLQRPPLPE